MNIKEAFDEISKKYDSQRKIFIPCFDDFYYSSLEIMNYEGKNPKILDIGAGTGLFSKIVMEKYPEGEYTLIDLSEKMLDMAKKRFYGQSNVKYIIGDYTSYDYKEKYDIVISAMSIHHLEDNVKEKLYHNIYNITTERGMFINADQVASSCEKIEEQFDYLWKRDIRKSGIDEEAIKMLNTRLKFDRTCTIEKQIEWLKEAGFKDAECLYKNRNFGAFFGMK